MIKTASQKMDVGADIARPEGSDVAGTQRASTAFMNIIQTNNVGEGLDPPET